MSKGHAIGMLAAAALVVALAGCSPASGAAGEAATDTGAVVAETAVATQDAGGSTETAAMTTVNAAAGGTLDGSSLFTERDLKQEADTSEAKKIELADGQDVEITEEGVYVVSGTASDATIRVNADDSAKVQIVLDGATITNGDAPAIYVVSADKVFVTTADGTTNALSVTGEFAADGETNTDAVIFSKDDLVLNGKGTLVISSTGNGVTSKDDLKVTGGTYEISAAGHGLEANDLIAIADGSFTIDAGTDALHSENSDDTTQGNIYVGGGTFDITAASDGLGGMAVVQVDDGTLKIASVEGIEGTLVQINGGAVTVSASDDGINATSKSTVGTPSVEINGGSVTIEMGAGDTDAIDSNGSITINGGTVDITANSPFDYDLSGELNGGTVTVNGEQVTELSNQFGGGMGGPGMQGGMQEGPGMRGGMQGGARNQGVI